MSDQFDSIYKKLVKTLVCIFIAFMNRDKSLWQYKLIQLKSHIVQLVKGVINNSNLKQRKRCEYTPS